LPSLTGGKRRYVFFLFPPSGIKGAMSFFRQRRRESESIAFFSANAVGEKKALCLFFANAVGEKKALCFFLPTPSGKKRRYVFFLPTPSGKKRHYVFKLFKTFLTPYTK
jgi:hypothetical protein